MPNLRERADAKPGPPHREQPEAIEPCEPSRPYRAGERYPGAMVRNELSRTLRSGELRVGVLTRSTRGEESWSWFFDGGLARPRDEDFVSHGDVGSEVAAVDALAHCWRRWLYWAGLHQVGELKRGVKR